MTPPTTSVSLNRKSLLATKFASKDETRVALTTLHVTDLFVEATDSYRAIRITHSPHVTKPTTGIDFCVPTDPLLKAQPFMVKDRAPKSKGFGKLTDRITGTVTLDPNKGTIKAEAATIIFPDQSTVGFPDMERILNTAIANDTHTEVAVSPTYLRDLAAIVASFRSSNEALVLHIPHNPLKPLLVTADNAVTEQHLTALLMPIRRKS